MSTFDPRKPAPNAPSHTTHEASALSISYSVKSGSHDDAEFILEGRREKARLLLCTTEDGEQATLILEDSEIEVLRDRLTEVLER